MKVLTSWSNRIMERYLPDPYIFVAILTMVVFLLGLGLTESGPLDMVVHWGDGFWELLSFTMQMVIVLVAGHVLASSPVFKKLVSTLAGFAKSPGLQSFSYQLFHLLLVGLTGVSVSLLVHFSRKKSHGR